MEGCTFSPSISKSKCETEISPERRRMKMIGNMDFNKKKAIWQKELKINEGNKNSRVVVVVLIYSLKRLNFLSE